MQYTKRRNSEFEANEEYSRLAEDDRQRPSEDEIARRAYERYEARGREDGHALDDWLDAERDLNGARPHQ
jgi:outer membrane protein TolC